MELLSGCSAKPLSHNLNAKIAVIDGNGIMFVVGNDVEQKKTFEGRQSLWPCRLFLFQV